MGQDNLGILPDFVTESIVADDTPPARSWRNGWRAPVRVVQRQVWDQHPVQISQPIDALFALDLSGVDQMRRPEAQSSYNGTRYNGDGGPLQSFGTVYGLQMQMARIKAAELPTAQGGSAVASSMLDLLGATVG